MKLRGRVLLLTLLIAGSSNAEIQPEVAHIEPTDVADGMIDDMAPVDTAVTTTDPALQEFIAKLVIPVKGIAATDLRNTFYELRGKRRHDALDIMAPRGTPVLSATTGRVLQLLKNGNGGLMVFAADASERFILFYAHLDDYAEGLKAGMSLEQGQILGYVGTTGNAPRNAPHLHFAIKRTDKGLRWSRGQAIDPYPLLTALPTAVSLGDDLPEQTP